MRFPVLLSVKWAMWQLCNIHILSFSKIDQVNLWCLLQHIVIFKATQCHCQGQSSVSPDVGCFWQEISAKQVLHCFPQHWWPPVRCSRNFATSQPEWTEWQSEEWPEWGMAEWGVTEWGVKEWRWHFSSGFRSYLLQLDFAALIQRIQSLLYLPLE